MNLLSRIPALYCIKENEFFHRYLATEFSCLAEALILVVLILL